jgi:hypothetical protein
MAYVWSALKDGQDARPHHPAVAATARESSDRVVPFAGRWICGVWGRFGPSSFRPIKREREHDGLRGLRGAAGAAG